MWSGPRNISTAMMRAFENRDDCAVWDEPFYAAWLERTGIDHPMREEILAAHETDWRKVAERAAAPAPDGSPIFYQKHMTHHMVEGIGRDWMGACRHAFLIRHPARVLASYARKRADPVLADIGFVEQAELFEMASELCGRRPPVVDADDLLADPRGILTALCAALEIPFSERMLAWPAGRRESDGVWAEHWYDAVWRSTGFQPAQPAPVLGEPRLRQVEAAALPIYERLAAERLRAI
ncbi:sulfotransferase family protein [Afifella sp. IM 167]|nr:sulfotransferase family protein [Afifella sp. IM 167]